MKLAGKTVLEHVIQAFQSHEAIHEILIVSNMDCIEEVESVVTNGRFGKVKAIIGGGVSATSPRWLPSMRRGITARITGFS
ncbi:2-C-methyl-D-erythritol 4-phosphate cytidylyltransferase [Stenotrophomonas sp. CD2]|nr:2-C-methyl-D-erythritol 4-phosphate cytidylyltransferase [Stenotrophomonas sp. CD2]